MKTNTNNRIAPVIDIVTGRPVETKRSVRNVAASVVAAATLGAGAFIMGANTAPEPPRGETVICVDETTQKAKPGDNLGAMTADKLDILSEEAKKMGVNVVASRANIKEATDVNVQLNGLPETGAITADTVYKLGEVCVVNVTGGNDPGVKIDVHPGE